MEVEVDWPKAKCRNDAGAPDFYPVGSGGRGRDTDQLQEEVAKYCRGTLQGHKPCPIRDQCLEYALRNEDYGVWGGETEASRRYIKKKRTRQRNRNAA